MSRPFEVGDIVRVMDQWDQMAGRWTVLMRPMKMNGHRLRLESMDRGWRIPLYAAPEKVELVTSIEERMAEELMS